MTPAGSARTQADADGVGIEVIVCRRHSVSLAAVIGPRRDGDGRTSGDRHRIRDCPQHIRTIKSRDERPDLGSNHPRPPTTGLRVHFSRTHVCIDIEYVRWCHWIDHWWFCVHWARTSGRAVAAPAPGASFIFASGLVAGTRAGGRASERAREREKIAAVYLYSCRPFLALHARDRRRAAATRRSPQIPHMHPP